MKAPAGWTKTRLRRQRAEMGLPALPLHLEEPVLTAVSELEALAARHTLPLPSDVEPASGEGLS